MTTTTAAPTTGGEALSTVPALVGHSNGIVTRIEVDDGNRLDVCDCHRLVWPAQSLTYVEGAGVWDCPLFVDAA